MTQLDRPTLSNSHLRRLSVQIEQCKQTKSRSMDMHMLQDFILISYRQTADTFQAAATFFELVNIWQAPDSETLAKIKYAKWNALRIVRAIKEGKDPNESNPKKEPEPEVLLELDPNDPEVRSLELPSHAKQPSVEEVPDEQDNVEARLARQSSIDQSLHPSAQVSARVSPAEKPPYEPYPRDGFPYTVATQNDNVSPMEQSPNERDGSVGGGYFPEVPTFTSDSQQPPLSTAPADDALNFGLPEQPSTLPGQQSPPATSTFSPPPNHNQASSAAPQDFYQQAPPTQQPPVKPQQPPQVPKFIPAPAPVPAAAPRQIPTQQSTSIFAPPPTQAGKIQYNTDDVAIAKAQKHARWAISALNFEDVDTAVRELRGALETLGAQ
jgi:vacuolar protein sorting-associated protein VTA1